MYIEVGTIEGGASDLRIYRTACMHSYMKQPSLYIEPCSYIGSRVQVLQWYLVRLLPVGVFLCILASNSGISPA